MADTVEMKIEGDVLVRYSGREADCVTVPDGVRHIGAGAFQFHKELRTVRLPRSLRTIGENAFRSCKGLTEILLPDRVTDIGERAFYQCSSLQTITLPPHLKTISANLFGKCSSLRHITLPERVETIEAWAFLHCIRLESIEMGSRLQAVNPRAFFHCPALKRLVCRSTFIPPIPTIEEGFLPLADPAACKNDAELFPLLCCYLRAQSAYSPEKAVQYRKILSLRQLSLLRHFAKQEQIELLVLLLETGLVKNAAIDTFLRESGDRADIRALLLEYRRADDPFLDFDLDPSGANEADWQAGQLREEDGLILYHYTGGDSHITIPETLGGLPVKLLASTLFMPSQAEDNLNGWKPTDLLEITVPKTVTQLGREVFYICDRLQAIHIHPDNPRYASIDGIVYNKDKTRLLFSPPSREGHVPLPEGVLSIAEGAFNRCYGLQGITLPQSLQSIGPGAFRDCAALADLDLPDGIAALGQGAFINCTALQQVTLSRNLTDLPDFLFYGCCTLQSLTLPDRLTHVGRAALGACYSLQEVICKKDAVTFDDDAFRNTPEGVVIKKG